MFIGHGNNQVSVKDNIIAIKLSGSFNEYGFQAIAKKVKQAVAQCHGERFCVLVNHLELLGATPEAYEELELLNQWLNEEKMYAKAIVIKLSTVLDTIKSRTPALGDQKIKVFDTEPDALIWLQAQLKEDS